MSSLLLESESCGMGYEVSVVGMRLIFHRNINHAIQSCYNEGFCIRPHRGRMFIVQADTINV